MRASTIWMKRRMAKARLVMVKVNASRIPMLGVLSGTLYSVVFIQVFLVVLG